MGKFKIYYFDARGRAEIIRLVLRATKQDYEEIHFSFKEWYQEGKKKSPSGQCPWVETPDGKVLTQSVAIAEMIAFDHGLLGKDSKETFLVARGIAQVLDLEPDLFKIHFAQGDEKAKLKQDFVDGNGGKLVSMIDEFLDEGKGFMANGRFTLADLSLMTLTDQLKTLVKEVYDKHPKLAIHYDKICEAAPAVGDYIKHRPFKPV